MILFENLDLSPLRSILWKSLHREGPGRPVKYDPECDLRALLLRQLEQIPYMKDLVQTKMLEEKTYAFPRTGLVVPEHLRSIEYPPLSEQKSVAKRKSSSFTEETDCQHLNLKCLLRKNIR